MKTKEMELSGKVNAEEPISISYKRGNIKSENVLHTQAIALNEVDSNLVTIPAKEEIKFRKIDLILKRFIDIIGGIVGVIILVPLTIMVGIAKLISKDKGPIFYTQDRIGKDGKNFKFYKFRSMVINADEKLKEMLEQDEELRKEYQKNKKLENDPRITKIGKFLRKTSLDEWPQFINVLKGEMSLVGPRPYLPREKDDMKFYYDSIIKFKPGITGPWQVNGRSKKTFNERMQIESTYADNFSIFNDIKMLIKTVILVVKKEGAI